MDITNTAQKYDRLSRTLHWIMALLIFTLLVVGTYMASLPATDGTKPTLYGMHKSFGSVFLVLIAVRLAWATQRRTPALPETLSAWERMLSKGATVGLYALMLAMPVSGVLMSNAFGQPVVFFGLFEFPLMLEKDIQLARALQNAHTIFAYGLLVLIGLHVAGAIKHRFFDQPENDVLKRMI